MMRTLWAVCMLICLASASGASLPNPQPPPVSPKPAHRPPTAYQWISSQPQLSNATWLINKLGLQQELSRPLPGTFLVPTNEAFAAFQAKMHVRIDDQEYWSGGFYDNFFTKLLQYHLLRSSKTTAQPRGNVQYGTRYSSFNGVPHNLTFIRNMTCKHEAPVKRNAGYKNGTSGGSTKPPVKCAANLVRDEQGNVARFVGPATTVFYRGVVMTVDKVLLANDLYPSLSALLSSSSNFSTLDDLLRQINADLGIDMVDILDGAPGTAALPNNQAFEGVNLTTYSTGEWTLILSNHFCPFTKAYRLLYVPFLASKPGKNPCASLFSRLAVNYFKYGLIWQYNSPKDITVGTLSGVYPTQMYLLLADIIMPDITLPIHSAHIITSVLFPPSGVPISVEPKQSTGTSVSPTRVITGALSGTEDDFGDVWNPKDFQA